MRGFGFVLLAGSAFAGPQLLALTTQSNNNPWEPAFMQSFARVSTPDGEQKIIANYPQFEYSHVMQGQGDSHSPSNMMYFGTCDRKTEGCTLHQASVDDGAVTKNTAEIPGVIYHFHVYTDQSGGGADSIYGVSVHKGVPLFFSMNLDLTNLTAVDTIKLPPNDKYREGLSDFCDAQGSYLFASDDNLFTVDVKDLTLKTTPITEPFSSLGLACDGTLATAYGVVQGRGQAEFVSQSLGNPASDPKVLYSFPMAYGSPHIASSCEVDAGVYVTTVVDSGSSKPVLASVQLDGSKAEFNELGYAPLAFFGASAF
jgi:hypothetical protein